MKELAASSIGYLEDLYWRYEIDPESVDMSWRCAFDLARELSGLNDRHCGERRAYAGRIALVVETLRQRGHLRANLDPMDVRRAGGGTAEMNLPRTFGGEVDIERLTSLYESSMTLETAHIDDLELRTWLIQAFETLPQRSSDKHARRALERLVEAHEFESLLSRKYPTKKRFGVEGAEAIVAMVDRLLDAASKSGIQEIVVGAMHRGRLNLMANAFGKRLVQLFAEFKGAHPFAADPSCAADVPYHLGLDQELNIEGRKLRITVAPNPSHLEAVDPVILGRVRARQDIVADPLQVLSVTMHTDAAVVGQGIVNETLQFAAIPGFSTHGTIHIVLNNQIGFTTEPWEARTSRYCTGPWKAVDAPIIHVNSDDVDACLKAVDLALAFRQAHGRDIVIDFICYRRNGHNELDEPRFTQPVAYAAIDKHASIIDVYRDALVARGIVKRQEVEQIASQYKLRMDEAFTAAGDWRPNETGYLNNRWTPFRPSREPAPEPITGIAGDRLLFLLEQLATPPEGMQLHPKVDRLIRQRRDAATKGAPWSLAEALAFASLVTDGTPVRLSGQDAVRGTFSNRHLSVVDSQTGERYSMIAELEPKQAPFTILNSPLSEYGVLGFEYGYSLERPDALVIWEAQFGDFANGAQIVIDQFISSGEEKWLQPSGLVMLVPHGLEGQGPEHSSARPERYLLLAARENIQIANPSTPANYFHLLRRQVLRRSRKPLIILAPKTLLRLPAAVSPLAEFEADRRFEPVLSTPVSVPPRGLILCTGKIAYELERECAQRPAGDVQIVRIEMIYPWPAASLSAIFAGSPRARIAWVQEEPENTGFWWWIRPRLEALAREAGLDDQIRYFGRSESSSPAGSFHGDHEKDQRAIIVSAIDHMTGKF